ncbi:carbohydrate kinase family protein [Actinotalea sp. Marseille-Q4924]|uniref:carbohydrate kinase family protein n=1 Tax=Actinotalea sp. Marseille-Q4924 TaxID=2866571 RepID=UPI001CE4647C|nr:carbohydrate kinase family protein [Actinotalea sp. Marseille-Q4924]
MREPYAVFFGDVAQDEFYAMPHFPASGDKVYVETLQPQFGGMVANAAAIYAHYARSTSFSSQLNSGALTQKLLRQLRELGLNTHHVIFDEDVPDSHCIIMLSGDQHIVLIPSLGITRTELTDATWDHFRGADFLFTTLTDSIPFRRGPLRAGDVLAELRRQGVLVVMDIDVYNPENHGSGLIAHCDILFMNAIGRRRFVETGNDIAALLAAGATAIVVTLDRGGCEVHTATGVELIDGHVVPVVDVTGAGDTFSSSFMFAYVSTRDAIESARFANAAAAMSVGHVGARGGMTTEHDVRAFLAHRPVLENG